MNWFHHDEPCSKTKGSRHPNTHINKTFKTICSAGKMMTTVLLVQKSFTLLEPMTNSKTMNSDHYACTQSNYERRCDVHLQYNDTLTRNAIKIKLKLHAWRTLPHTSYIPDLAPSGLNQIRLMKETPGRQ